MFRVHSSYLNVDGAYCVKLVFSGLNGIVPSSLRAISPTSFLHTVCTRVATLKSRVLICHYNTIQYMNLSYSCGCNAKFQGNAMPKNNTHIWTKGEWQKIQPSCQVHACRSLKSRTLRFYLVGHLWAKESHKQAICPQGSVNVTSLDIQSAEMKRQLRHMLERLQLPDAKVTLGIEEYRRVSPLHNSHDQ